VPNDHVSAGEAEIQLPDDPQPSPEGATDEQPQTSDPPTTSIKEEESASHPASASTSSSDSVVGTLGCLGFILFFAGIMYVGFAENFRKDPRHTEMAKWEVYLVPAICLLVLIAIGIVIYLHPRSPRVARMTDIFSLVFVSLLVGLAPIVLLGPVTQQASLRLAGILLLSILPASLYFLFLVVRGRTLWEEFVYTLQRLDAFEYGPLPDLAASDPKNPYRQKFEALYGKNLLSPLSDRNETLTPVFLCTIMLSLGWAAVLQPPSAIGLELHSLTAIQGVSQSLPATALKYGFIGSYFFALEMIVRRYFQDDLRISAYVNVMVRIVVVALLVSVVHLVWPSDASTNIEWALAFLIGIFPQVGLLAIRTAVTRALGNDKLFPSLKIEYPLSRLDGLNFWYEARLLETGIEDMQNLATANIVDVMLNTRIPVGRLVDWLDQALLYIRLDEGKNTRAQRVSLRAIGIRSATDFVSVITDRDCGAQFQEFVIGKLNGRTEEGGVSGGNIPWSQAILKSLEGEPNLMHVQAWRSTRDPMNLVRKPPVVRS
jgi:hypothetical protein